MGIKKRFAFIDGLSGLYLPTQKAKSGREGQGVLSTPDLTAISTEIQNAIKHLSSQDDTSKVLLVIDQLDLLLASGGERIGPVDVGDMLLELREVRYIIPTRVWFRADIVIASPRNGPGSISGQSLGI